MISEMSCDSILIYTNYIIDECKGFRRIVSYKPYEECPICYEVTKTPVKSVCNHCYCEGCYSKIRICSLCRTDLMKPEHKPLREGRGRVIEALRDFIVFSIDEPPNECELALGHIANLLLLHPDFDINDVEGSYNRIHGIDRILELHITVYNY